MADKPIIIASSFDIRRDKGLKSLRRILKELEKLPTKGDGDRDFYELVSSTIDNGILNLADIVKEKIQYIETETARLQGDK